MRRVRWLAEALGFLLLSGVFCALPRSWAHGLGRVLGGLALRISRRSRDTALENLKLALNLEGAEARRIALASHRQAGAAIADLLRAPRLTEARARRDIEVGPEAEALIERMRREAKAPLIACCHFGNWELLNLIAPYEALPPMTVIVRPVPNPILNRMLSGYRARTGQRIIRRAGAVGASLRSLRSGGTVAIVFDVPVPPDSGAVPVDFFGRAAFTTSAIGFLAVQTGAPVYLTCLEPLHGARYRLRIEGPVEAPGGLAKRETMVELTRAVSRLLEEVVRARPEAWAWWIKRWSIRPEGDSRTYPSYAHDEKWFWPHGTKPRRDPSG